MVASSLRERYFKPLIIIVHNDPQVPPPSAQQRMTQFRALSLSFDVNLLSFRLHLSLLLPQLGWPHYQQHYKPHFRLLQTIRSFSGPIEQVHPYFCFSKQARSPTDALQ